MLLELAEQIATLSAQNGAPPREVAAADRAGAVEVAIVRQATDHTGQVFGRLTVLERAGMAQIYVSGLRSLATILQTLHREPGRAAPGRPRSREEARAW